MLVVPICGFMQRWLVGWGGGSCSIMVRTSDKKKWFNPWLELFVYMYVVYIIAVNMWKDLGKGTTWLKHLFLSSVHRVIVLFTCFLIRLKVVKNAIWTFNFEIAYKL